MVMERGKIAMKLDFTPLSLLGIWSHALAAV